MRTAETLFMTLMGAAFLHGVRLTWRQFAAWVHTWSRPAAPAVVTWEYCIAGDHMARSDHMAWYGETFLCDECVYGSHPAATERAGHRAPADEGITG